MLRPLTRILTIAGICLALTAQAAQAYPHGVHRHGPPWFAPAGPAAQQRPVTKVVSSSDGGFSYLDTAIGAAVAAGLVGIFVLALRRPHGKVAV